MLYYKNYNTLNDSCKSFFSRDFFGGEEGPQFLRGPPLYPRPLQRRLTSSSSVGIIIVTSRHVYSVRTVNTRTRTHAAPPKSIFIATNISIYYTVKNITGKQNKTHYPCHKGHGFCRSLVRT